MKRLVFLLSGVGILWIFCTEYNPFENSTNINMVIKTQNTSLHVDSLNMVSIFTTETLTVAATLREEIDSFSVTAPGNRYWEKRSFSAPILSSDYIFYFSYPDTGQRIVTLNTYRNNGDIIPVTFSCIVTSPLAQNPDPLTVESGAICSLATQPVGDNDVVYHWRFQKYTGQPLVVSYPSSNYSVQIDEVLSGNTGYLWVADDSGNTSPEVSFAYTFIDTTGPVIFCVNEGLVGDTVITGTGSFIFKVECNDGLGISSALINNTAFSDSTVNIKSTAYYKTFTDMDTLTAYFTAAVTAWDNVGNANVHTFYIRYDVNGPKEVIVIKYPPQNPYTTNQNSYDIVAGIFNPEDDSVIATIHHIETDDTTSLDTLAAGDERDVGYTAALQLGSNTLVITVMQMDSLNTVCAKDTVFITYTTGTIDDNSPPYISSIQVNGNEGKAHFIAGDVAILTLQAFDEHMDSVVINGKLKSEVQRFLWMDTLSLDGGQQFFIIHLTDSSGNCTNDTVLVQKNLLPEINPPVSFPKTLVIGRPWSTIFKVIDSDGDSIDVTHVPGIGGELPDPGSIVLRKMALNRWLIRWIGSVSDVSINKSYQTELVLSDGKQKNNYQWDFSIKDTSQAVSYIFKMFLPEGIDTTEEGNLDLSQFDSLIDISCLVTGDVVPLLASDSIAIFQPDQTIRFAATADTTRFTLSFNPHEKKEDETVMVHVIDSAGIVTPVDTFAIIYYHPFPDEIDSLGWLLRTDTGVHVEEERVYEWISTYGNALKLSHNTYTTDIYGMETTPRFIESNLLENALVRFSPEEHSNLLNPEEHWIRQPFTLFFVARLAVGGSGQQDSGSVLISSGLTQYVGLGVFNGKIGVIGQLNDAVDDRDSIITCNMKVPKAQWHILCYSSTQSVNAQTFRVQMWVDGYGSSDNTIDLPVGILSNDNIQALILGGGSKHTASRNWRGDIGEVVRYTRPLTEEERDFVFKYLASKYKIRLHQ